MKKAEYNSEKKRKRIGKKKQRETQNNIANSSQKINFKIT
jgi:hypothetical protein